MQGRTVESLLPSRDNHFCLPLFFLAECAYCLDLELTFFFPRINQQRRTEIMVGTAAANAPDVDHNHSTLEVVEDHPDAMKFAATSQQANGLHPNEHSTLEVDQKDKFSTLESYRNADKADTSEKIALDSAISEEEVKPPKEAWKGRRVCGVSLLFLLIGGALVVVIAAVVGGVVGSRSKDARSPADATVSASPPATNTSLPAAVSTQPSDPWFTKAVPYSIWTESEDGAQSRFEGPKAHNRTPDDAVFLGSPVPGNSSQNWDFAWLSSDLATKYTPRTGPHRMIFYLRLQGTNLAAQIDDVVWDSIAFGNKINATRKDVPVVLRNFNAEEKNQMWYLNKADVAIKTDCMLNLGLFNSNWTMGVGPDFRASMVLEQHQEKVLTWKLLSLRPPPAST